ncbi:potassium channel protein [Paenalkalicoccus suaedae]|uniref:Potassium channel protein n=1 Tax=Paenalkalicoccus suaedae TaxID=2592382 RepID=A0A859FH88_9BACI|nr:potassium channel family protein [Paenalkalicoccus suaedae]QKS72160.1 potassium channel protein [Paenalkalicoccus suaedae]
MYRDLFFAELYAHKWMVIRLSVMVLFFICLAGLSVYLMEPESFPTIPDGMWWAFVTITTVGYGDLVPVTQGGRLIAVLLMLTGIALFSFFLANASVLSVVAKEELQQGKGYMKSAPALLIIGWNERTHYVIQHAKQRPIVIIDDTLSALQQSSPSIRYIRGNPCLDDTLLRANIKEAAKVIITANLHIAHNIADATSILTLISIKALHPKAFVVVEVISSAQEIHAVRAGADQVIVLSSKIGEYLTESLL